MPFESTLFTIHPDVEVVLFTGGNLCSHQHSGSAVIEFEQHRTVVIDLATLNHNVQHGTDLRDARTRDVFCKVSSMRSNVANCATSTRLLRVSTPRCLLIARLFKHR